MTEKDEGIAVISGLSHKYGSQFALQDINLQIPAGCLAGVIGPDGVGKSTLLGLIAGVRVIQKGDLRTLQGDMRSRKHRQSCVEKIAYMPQGLGKNLYPTLSVYENIEFFGRLFGQDRQERRQRIHDLLIATGLLAFSRRPAGKLSGGMKQKLGLCCALIHDPDLLILDEPTTGVDPLSRRQFWTLIDTLRARHPSMSVLVATAYMEEADQFDWLAAMDEGRLTATGTPDELKAKASCETLEEAFIQLLPAEKRVQHDTLIVPPRVIGSGEVAIYADGLTKRFGDFVAVDHVGFEIERGEIFGFLGSNGCGKTTTMKILTGLLPASEGSAQLFGKNLDARDMQTRRRIGYMSQSFSLYGELTVLKNLELHAEIFHLPKVEQKSRVQELLERFDLDKVQDQSPNSLPLGVRQRLQLAVAILHKPEVLILDEPTSGVDPIARDEFWRILVQLSRQEGVTIFISTHFMNEAERCDRISLMHAGKVLAIASPAELMQQRNAETLNDAFVGYLEDAIEVVPEKVSADEKITPRKALTSKQHRSRVFSLQRMWAYAVREAKELIRDPIRMVFSLVGPIILMITFGYGISFDVEDISYAVMDHDQSLESRVLLENFSGSRYFSEQPQIQNPEDLETRMKKGDLTIAIEIPAGFGKDLLRGLKPEVGVWIDGSMPFRAETARGYIEGNVAYFLNDMTRRKFGVASSTLPYDLQTRFRYNQTFKSTYAMVPGTIMLLCILIPAMMTAVGIVREKEMGSITNLYATPVTRTEFLLGKQLPYILLAYLNFISLVSLALFLFAVPLKGSLAALALGALIYVAAATGFGLLISAFVRSQIAAIFATAIINVVLTMNFSGFLTPVSTLGGGASIMGKFFPAPYFQQISVGSFTKALGFFNLWPNHVILLAFAVAFFMIAAFLLRKQEK